MSRPLRIEYEGALYHVTSRGWERGSEFRIVETPQSNLSQGMQRFNGASRPNSSASIRLSAESRNIQPMLVTKKDLTPVISGAGIKEGDTVQHPTYGRGKVMALSGYGDDTRASVRFATVGVKHLVLKFARMKKV